MLLTIDIGNTNIEFGLFKGPDIIGSFRLGTNHNVKMCIRDRSCITQLASTILQIAMNNSLVYYGNQSPVGGDIALSAMGIVVKVSAILIAVDIGIGIGSQPILGFNRGANQPRRIKQTYRIAVTMATIVSTAGWLV